MSKTKMPPSRMRLEVKNAAKTIGVLLSSVAALIFSSPKGYGMENFNSLNPIANLFYSMKLLPSINIMGHTFKLWKLEKD